MGEGQLEQHDQDPASALALRWSRHLAFDRRRSAHTVRAYVATAHRLIAFLVRHRGEAVGRYGLMNLAAVDLRAFLADRRGDGLGPSSAAREMSAVRAFLRFAAEEEGNLPQLPRTRSPKRPRTLPRPASPADALALAETAGEGVARSMKEGPARPARGLHPVRAAFAAQRHLAEAERLKKVAVIDAEKSAETEAAPEETAEKPKRTRKKKEDSEPTNG